MVECSLNVEDFVLILTHILLELEAGNTPRAIHPLSSLCIEEILHVHCAKAINVTLTMISVTRQNGVKIETRFR